MRGIRIGFLQGPLCRVSGRVILEILRHTAAARSPAWADPMTSVLPGRMKKTRSVLTNAVEAAVVNDVVVRSECSRAVPACAHRELRGGVLNSQRAR